MWPWARVSLSVEETFYCRGVRQLARREGEIVDGMHNGCVCNHMYCRKKQLSGAKRET